MRLAIIGTGYVGLVTGACLAESGNVVVCVDKDKAKVAVLNSGRIPFYEPGLAEFVQRNQAQGRLLFTQDLHAAVQSAEVVFICVGTPATSQGEADTTAVFAVAEGVARAINGPKIVVTKSTVPVGTTDRLGQTFAESAPYPVEMVSNPEFLKQGDAVNDFMKPDHIVIGTASPVASNAMQELYAPFVRTGSPILQMDTRSAELTKYATNAMLATRISFMNELANLAELLGANIDSVRRGLGADRRIGSSFIFPGVGYGGSCLPKDVKALIHMGREQEYRLAVCEAVNNVNEQQILRVFERMAAHFGGSVSQRHIALWGLAFKPNTDDLREAPSLRLIDRLLSAGSRVSAYDPKAMVGAASILGTRVRFTEDSYGAIEGADALVLLTEWNEFRNPDFERMKKLMAQATVFDGRNIYDADRIKKLGFAYYGVGRS